MRRSQPLTEAQRAAIQRRQEQTRAHSELVARIIVELEKRLPVRLFKRVTGTAKLQSGQWARLNIPGQSDIYGFLRGGRAVEVEVKTGGAVPEPEQRAWRDTCERFGVLHIVAHSVEEAEAAVRAALAGGRS